MSESYTVKAEAREKVGKGAARHLRRNGMVPAVIYGDKQEPLPIAVPYKETFLKLHGGGFLTTVITIDVGGKQIKVLPKDYQLDVVKDTLTHVDYLRVSDRTEVTVRIPVHFENEDAAPGIKAQDGTLNVVHHDIEVVCAAQSIPEGFTLDLTGLEIGDAVSSSALKLPKGVRLTTDEEFVIATIVPPMAEEVDELDAETPETEVIEQTDATAEDEPKTGN
ncbi:50S ribosomal protein L25/general stress protein Ctc [Aureimonas phyllosphaerae]|uniref:Large ribosomal subunit protein bL25 n=1 Tax=Aureimonas phyllosphaerae TaxID=1166078 RepID=A0A7W6BVF8_9HYPH|nr:50S ribosomal protein L25/general stress protein Ctc [Aureimonas phyllosphaerae]MBB3935803.1 large subunit ribosomal protein L25 [Aureimonas phyllosphaerae]MBB3959811.1 large subunit ribosomal protein L25 [Aureimonas phyllosphaerae]SFF15290.1 LSU ribosomal protein L25P [Aureimonas phyllosphaerae]